MDANDMAIQLLAAVQFKEGETVKELLENKLVMPLLKHQLTVSRHCLAKLWEDEKLTGVEMASLDGMCFIADILLKAAETYDVPIDQETDS